MKVVVDGVFFQLASSGIARVWASLLPYLARRDDVDLVLLDRGGCPDISGARRIDFPSYQMTAYNADDSLRLDRLCHGLNVDVFMSTYYTTVTSIPQILMVYDMIPEVMGFDLSARPWQEKQLAISFAQSFGCISHQTAIDLRRFHPQIASERVQVIPCGVDRSIFHPADPADIERFRQLHGLRRDYFLLVGSRQQHSDYKNARLFFNALKKCGNTDFDVVCVGGEPEIEEVWRNGLPSEISVQRLVLSDQELGIAYSGSAALIYPSLYEGFGMPVIEAMACGCPVVTTHHGSLREVADDAALIISGHDELEMLAALDTIRRPEVHASYAARGLSRASRYEWEQSESLLYPMLHQAIEDGGAPSRQRFFADWRRLRKIQADVDVGR